MIAEAYEGSKWGSNGRAIAARSKRIRTLREDRFAVFTREVRYLDGYVSYELVAIEEDETKVVVPFIK